MKILVTGACGFIGRALSQRLIQRDYEVTGLDLVDGLIQDKATLVKYTDYHFDHVFHLAASGTIQDSWEKIPEYIENITVGTGRVMDFCQKTKTSYTYISSYMYGMPKFLPIDETHPTDSTNPYALVKRLSEDVCQFYSTEFEVKGTIIRPFVIFGPGQQNSFLIPTLVNQVLHSDRIVVNDLAPKKRDYLYINDFVDVIEKTINPVNSYSIYNVGMGESFTIQELIDIIQGVAGTSKPVESRHISRKNDYTDVIASINKVKKELQWEPKFDMRSAIARYMEEVNG